MNEDFKLISSNQGLRECFSKSTPCRPFCEVLDSGVKLLSDQLDFGLSGGVQWITFHLFIRHSTEASVSVYQQVVHFPDLLDSSLHSANCQYFRSVSFYRSCQTRIWNSGRISQFQSSGAGDTEIFHSLQLVDFRWPFLVS